MNAKGVDAMNGQSVLSTTKVAVYLVLALTWFQLVATPAWAQRAFVADETHLARPRILERIDDSVTVHFPNSTPRALRNAVDLGRMDGSTKLGPLFLVLKSSPEQEHALHTLLDQQQDKSTPNYHRWLTPNEFGTSFGVEASDLQKVTDWLSNQGFVVQNVARGQRSVTFSGTVAQVEAAFHTELHNFLVRGERHFSNSEDISIPAALNSVVGGVAPLDDFKPRHVRALVPTSTDILSSPQGVGPDYTTGVEHYFTPGDFAIIYNTQPLLQGETGGLGGAIDGNNQTIAILGELTTIQPNDPNIQQFRQLFLPNYNANNTNIIPPPQFHLQRTLRLKRRRRSISGR